MSKLSYYQHHNIIDCLEDADGSLSDVASLFREAGLMVPAGVIRDDSDRLVAYIRWMADQNQAKDNE